MIRLYLVRHGQTEMNKKKVYYGRLDVSLDEEGRSQCVLLGEKLAEVAFDQVVTSSLKRAVESAELILGEKRMELVQYEQLCELDFGLWEGLHHTEVAQKYPMEWEAWSKEWMDYRIPGGESFRMMYDRVSACFDRILMDSNEKTILLVAHEGTLKIIATRLLGLKPENYWSFHFEYGCYSMFELHNELAVARCLNC